MDKIELINATKSIFLQCLNEPDVLEAIKKKLSTNQEYQMYYTNVIDNDNYSVSSQILERLDEILDSQNTIKSYFNSEFKKENKDLSQSELDKIKEIYETEISEIKKINEKLKNNISNYSIFKECLEVWNAINSLNDDNRSYINSLCGGKDLLAILSLGRDDGRIEQLWSFLRDKAVKGDIEKAEVIKLNQYFEFCLQVANSSKSENECYVFSAIEIGSEFDMNLCIRTTDSKQIGEIKNVIVKCVTVQEKVKFQAIVKVE